MTKRGQDAHAPVQKCPHPENTNRLAKPLKYFYIDPMSYMERITFNPKQCGGRPCIRGMRIRVIDVLDLLAAGVSEEEILEDYPDLEAGDIRASLQYASAQLNHSVLQHA